MVRILYWNLQKFSGPKIKGMAGGPALMAQDRLNHILEVITPGWPKATRAPDIIVIVEVFAGTAEVLDGGVVLPSDSNAAGGVLTLLEAIRLRLGPNWWVVPPIPTGSYGKREAVAVFYNSDNLIFAGPYVYAKEPVPWNPLNKALPPTPVNLGNMVKYDYVWTQFLHPDDDNRRSPAPDGTLVYESQWAGDWQHLRNNQPMNFPNANDRKPFFVRFREVHGPRVIKVFGVHTSPTVAAGATRQLEYIPDVATVANDEVAVVVGDFNVDPFFSNSLIPNLPLNHLDNPYEGLVNTPGMGGLGYRMVINPCPPGSFVPHPNRMPYCLTFLLPTNVARPFNANGVAPTPQQNVYPRFGYLGSYYASTQTVTDQGCYDNAFVKYGPNLNPIASHMATIVNPVVGKPYDKAPLPAGVTADLTGGYPQPSWIAPPIPQPGGINPGPLMNAFDAYGNYWLIRSVSDHLALAFDV
ncbi:hypothetical protein Aph01nite_46470 [Acrocarpospora phusangensis]|uniref:Endonuclease/exonuclease/phosphatase domain-containing protein n=1 Tax=Acrocarpospora phusangensis TaxID=1070424 RepID=A0A919QHJ5_9ACTN|nr:hypothetical protein [Acrocarpospora phusangensis]GIH26337.1 hypothetical protein Aph01nite_46470 [Acrocarpospora phusangensis]